MNWQSLCRSGRRPEVKLGSDRYVNFLSRHTNAGYEFSAAWAPPPTMKPKSIKPAHQKQASLAPLPNSSRSGASREGQRALDLVLAAGKMGVWTREVNGGNRVLWSPELEAIFGLDPGEFAGTEQAFLDLIHPDDRAAFQAALAKAIDNRTDYEVEFRFLPRNRPIGYMLGRGRSSYDAEGRPSGLTSVGIDITGIKAAGQEIRELNAQLERRVREGGRQLEIINKELESFSYSVSHDLRAPLRSIRGFSEALLERYADKLDARGQEFLKRACESSEHMDLLIENLLQLSRVTRAALKRQPVNLTALAETIVSELRNTEPQRVVNFTIAPDLSAQGDEALLRIALDHLLRNAWKFTAGKSPAVIELGRTAAPETAFYLRDNGAGFDMAYAGKLFGVFQRLHSTSEFPGTGVGLATVQRIINRHGGRLWGAGRVGEGATFYFTLPAEAEV